MNAIHLDMPWGNLDKLNMAGKKMALPSMGEMLTNPANKTEFSSYLTGKLDNVSELVHQSEQKVEDFLIDPDSVDPHDVTLALAKANMAVSMTKQVVDSAIKAYREITSLR